MKKKKFLKVVLLCLSFILCLGLFVGCSESEEDKKGNEKFGIYENTKGLIEGKLKAPSTAKFQEFDESLVEKISDNEYKVKGYVDAENSFGANIRSNWSCTVRIEGEGDDQMIKTDDILIDNQ
ncbi:hypothetical protein NRP93_000531 [Clostridium botulinum]|nr:hypothetical protein [Clostridium botulinum]